MNQITKSFDVYGMHCKSCEANIEYELNSLKGVFSVKASYTQSNVIIIYEDEYLNENEIKKAIKKAGYSTSKNSLSQLFGLGLVVAIMLFLSNNSLFGFDTNSLLSNASLFMLFVVGLLSSLHCVGMCGGIMLTQTLDKDNLLNGRKSSFNTALKYNLGRVISYTLLGGIIASIGSVFSVSMKIQGFIQLIAALFMIIAGINMFGLKLFKNININIPLLKKNCEKSNKSPFIVGLLNGFMPCGPLQTMQLYALGTGSFVMGALSMFSFSMGTVPLMIGFGYVSSKLSKTLSNNIFKYSGVFIILLGLAMGQRGLALTGTNIALLSSSPQSLSEFAPVVDGYQEITIIANRYGYTPSDSLIKSDIPIKLTIKAEELTSCNNAIYFPQFDQYVDLSQGDIVAEINPNGQDISFTCWMGMIRGSIQVSK
ncbi:MAG: sulfite exporter TauE/SafE family protein [Peptostreptococcaceae bacterium]